MNIYVLIVLLVILVVGVVLYFKVKRNYFNKFKYVRIVTYNEDMSIKVSYQKKESFNKDNSILINPKHVYNYNGYTSIIKTSLAQESINPIDFESKFDAKIYKTAIRSKLIGETFESLKADKFDKIMALLFLNVMQLIAISYLVYELVGGTVA